MTNSAELMGFFTGPREVTNTDGKTCGCQNTENSGFVQVLQSIKQANAESAESVSPMDMDALIAQLKEQGEVMMAELLSLLQSVQLVNVQEVQASELNLEAQNPLQQLQQILENLMQSMVAGMEEKVNGQPAHDFQNVLAQCLEKCSGIAQIQKQMLAHLNGVRFAENPGDMEPVLQKIQIKITQTVLVQNAEVDGNTAAFDPEATASNPEVFVAAKIRIVQIFTQWKEMSKENTLKVEKTPVTDAQNAVLQTENIFKVAQSLRQDIASNGGETTNPGNAPTLNLQQELEKLIGQETEAQKSGMEVNPATENLDEALMALLKNSNGTEKTQSRPLNLAEQIQKTVVHQLVDRIRIIRSNGGVQEVRIQLEPKELGHVNMKLELDGSNLTARMTVESTAVKQAVEAGLNQLRETLATQGFKVEKFDVNVQEHWNDPSQGKEAQDQWAMRTGWRRRVKRENENGEIDPLRYFNAAGAFGLDTGRRYGYNTLELFA